MKTIIITNAKYLFDYKIEFTFSNNKIKVVDFESFLYGSKNPMNTKYRDIEKFKKFKIENEHHIYWGKNMEMCFPFEDLYKGGIIPPPNKEKIKKMAIKYFGKKKAKQMFKDAELLKV